MALALVGSKFTLTTADRVLQEGDSISALDTSTQMPMLVKRRLYNLAAQTPFGPMPFWTNTAVSNQGANAQLIRILAGLGKFQPTKFIWIYGTAPLLLADTVGTVNDTTNATILGCFRLVMDACAQQGIQAYVGSVNCVGEKWPTGANGAGDANVDALVAGLAVISARYNTVTFRDLRSTFYAVQEPLVNIANTTMGPYMRPDPLGVHHNPGGRGASDNIIANDFNIVAASGANVSPLLYSGAAIPSPTGLGLDFDPSGTGVGDGANVTAWTNAGLFGATANLPTTAATKPVMRLVAQAGKIANASAVQSAGAAWIRSATFAAKAQPMLTALLWQSTNITASQILYDGNTGSQEPSLATIATSGVVEPNGGVAFDQPAIVAGTWNLAITYWGGAAALSGSYTVLNGAISGLGNAGQNSRSGLTLFASAGSALISTAMIARFMEWHSSLGPLPRWQDVQGYFQTKYGGAFPQ